MGPERRLRIYLNGDRVIDVNQVELPAIASVGVHMWTGVKSIGFRSVRFAESTPDFGQTMMASGKFVTHGILFDTDSDHVKPESAAVMQMIAHAADGDARPEPGNRRAHRRHRQRRPTTWIFRSGAPRP